MHDRDRVVEVGPQRLPRAVALRRGGDARRRRASSPTERLELIERERVNVVCQAPTEYRVLPKRTRAAAAALGAADGLRRRGAQPRGDRRLVARRPALEIADGYGQTETGHLAGNLVGDEVATGSMGKPAARGRGADRRRELEVRVASCPTFFSRYLDARAVRGRVVVDRRRRPRRRPDGYLWYEGRDDDLILSAGYRIGPFEVESALLTHPAVAEAAAVAAPDAERGSVVRAIVVPRDREPSDELARELQEHVKATTAPYKYPRIVEFADELPKTASGKIKRAELRALR